MTKIAKSLVALLAMIMVSLTLVNTVYAQYDPCLIPPGYYRTETMGGWGANCHGGNAGCLRDTYFDTVFPSGLTVGGIYTMHFTSAAAINTYLPPSGDGEPGVLTMNHTNPAHTEAGEFAGQVVALALSIGFSNADLPVTPPFGPHLADLMIPGNVPAPFGVFGWWTVQQVFDLANQVLGGDTSLLPPGIDLPDLNELINDINGTFDDGLISTHFLVEEDCREPVELTSFDAIGGETAITVRWRTASESGIAYYEVSRSDGGNWQTIGTVSSLGDNAAGSTYLYTDATAAEGMTYNYRLTIHGLDGSVALHNEVASASLMGSASPSEFALLQNYPNPFNPTTTITYSLKEASHVKLTVFDPVGRVVATLVNGERSAGSHSVMFDGNLLSAGLYFYRLEAGSMNDVRKMILLK